MLDQAVTSPDRALGEFALRPDDQPVPQRDETVLDGLGRRAATGELGEIAAHWAGGWLGTGRTGRYRPDGTVEPAPVPVVRPAVSPEFAQGAGVRSRPAFAHHAAEWFDLSVRACARHGSTTPPQRGASRQCRRRRGCRRRAHRHGAAP